MVSIGGGGHSKDHYLNPNRHAKVLHVEINGTG
jgi:hypothetical protein